VPFVNTNTSSGPAGPGVGQRAAVTWNTTTQRRLPRAESTYSESDLETRRRAHATRRFQPKAFSRRSRPSLARCRRNTLTNSDCDSSAAHPIREVARARGHQTSISLHHDTCWIRRRHGGGIPPTSQGTCRAKRTATTIQRTTIAYHAFGRAVNLDCDNTDCTPSSIPPLGRAGLRPDHASSKGVVMPDHQINKSA